MPISPKPGCLHTNLSFHLTSLSSPLWLSFQLPAGWEDVPATGPPLIFGDALRKQWRVWLSRPGPCASSPWGHSITMQRDTHASSHPGFSASCSQDTLCYMLGPHRGRVLPPPPGLMYVEPSWISLGISEAGAPHRPRHCITRKLQHFLSLLQLLSPLW